MRDSAKATLVVPAFNERERIEACLRLVARWRETRPGGWDWEVIVVDDGSSDGTRAVARRVAEEEGLPIELLWHEANRGKGAAIRTGVLASCGDPVLVSDTDLSTPLTEWVKLAERLPTHPISIGSRALDEGLVRRKQALYRRLAGKLGNKLIRLLAVRGIRDTQCGFKLFRSDAAHDLFHRLHTERFAFDVEILVAARVRGHAVREVPVNWTHQPGSRINLVTDSFRMAVDLLRIRWRAARGVYDDAGVAESRRDSSTTERISSPH